MFHLLPLPTSNHHLLQPKMIPLQCEQFYLQFTCISHVTFLNRMHCLQFSSLSVSHLAMFQYLQAVQGKYWSHVIDQKVLLWLGCIHQRFWREPVLIGLGIGFVCTVKSSAYVDKNLGGKPSVKIWMKAERPDRQNCKPMGLNKYLILPRDSTENNLKSRILLKVASKRNWWKKRTDVHMVWIGSICFMLN